MWSSDEVKVLRAFIGLGMDLCRVIVLWVFLWWSWRKKYMIEKWDFMKDETRMSLWNLFFASMWVCYDLCEWMNLGENGIEGLD